MDLDEETMEAMFGQDLASDTDILGMWIPEVLDWPTWVCVTLCYSQRAAITISLFIYHALLLTQKNHVQAEMPVFFIKDTGLLNPTSPNPALLWHERLTFA